MDKCYCCDIEYKVKYCCGSHPETMEIVALQIKDGRVVRACPNLNESGECKVYDDRPELCREYECPTVNEMDIFERIQSHSNSF